MGFAGILASQNKDKQTAFPKLGKPARSSWREVFGDSSRDKEEGYVKVPADGGSYGRSNISTANSFKRLLEAMRSLSPGGWTDDRWEQSKRFVDIVYVAIHRQNELLTQAEFQVFEEDENAPEGKIPARSSGARELIELLKKPNKEDGFGDLLSNWNLQMDLTGSALTWMVPNALGKPYELYPIPTAMAIPQPVLNPEFPNGFYRIQPLYPYGPFSSYPTPSSSVGAPIPAEWMMKFKYPHPLLRYEGYSPLTALRLPLDTISAIDRSRGYKMRRGINPDAVLSFEDSETQQDLPDSEIDRLVAMYENDHQGPENHGRLLIPPKGGKFEEWGTAPKDMDWQAGWEQLTSFALSAMGITKPAAGMVEDSAYATLFASLKQLYWLTLDPKVSRIARKLTRFLAPFFGDNLIIEIRCKRIDDHEIKFGRVDRAMQAKCVTKNEVRQELDWPATKEEWGEEIAGQEEQQQQGMPGQEQGSNNNPNGGGGVASFFDGAQDEDKETEQQQPDPGTLNEGSLGPRMGTVKSLRMDIYKRAKGEFLNGYAAK